MVGRVVTKAGDRYLRADLARMCREAWRHPARPLAELRAGGATDAELAAQLKLALGILREWGCRGWHVASSGGRTPRLWASRDEALPSNDDRHLIAKGAALRDLFRDVLEIPRTQDGRAPRFAAGTS